MGRGDLSAHDQLCTLYIVEIELIRKELSDYVGCINASIVFYMSKES